MAEESRREENEKAPVLEPLKLMWEDWESRMGLSKKALRLNCSPFEKRNWFNGAFEKDKIEPSPDLLIPLLPHQKEHLQWSIKQEWTWTGGLLTDEDGMENMIQAISLILTSLCIKYPHSAFHSEQQKLQESFNNMCLPEVKATLVVCTPSSIKKWTNDISKYVKLGTLKVMIYPCPNGRVDLTEISGQDIVLTTYKTVQLEHGNSLSPKNPCELCGNFFSCKKMKKDAVPKSICGPCEKAVLTQGSSEKKTMRKKKTKKALEETPQSPVLHAVKWKRVIINEAQCIGDGRSVIAKALFALRSYHRWILTGIPIQNQIGELYPLVRFLEIEPFSYYFCNHCNCKNFDCSDSYSVGVGLARCKTCGHLRYYHFRWWRKYVEKPIEEHWQGNNHSVKSAIIVLDEIFRRKIKHEGETDPTLPPRTVVVRQDSLDKKEKAWYHDLEKRKIKLFSKGSGGTNWPSQNFHLYMRLRQAADHSYMVLYSCQRSALAGGDDSNHPGIAFSSTQMFCHGCNDIVEDAHVMTCKHSLCEGCKMDIQSRNRQIDYCPVCDNILIAKGAKNALGLKRESILDRIDLRMFETSTKINALREEIEFMMMNDVTAKGVVFSHFTSFLDIIGFYLQKSSIKCAMLDSSMSIKTKEKMIEIFTNDSDCKVILMNIKADGGALNLTVASHVFLMEPGWNSVAEQQAQARVYRLGQYKPVKVVRFIIKNTVDGSMLQQQEDVRKNFERANGTEKDRDSLSQAATRFLFSACPMDNLESKEFRTMEEYERPK